LGAAVLPALGMTRRQVIRMIKFLDGATKDVIKELNSEMEDHSNKLEFEEAAKVRDLRDKLVKTTSSSRQIAGLAKDCDLCGIARDGEDASGVVMRVRGGHILTTHHFLLSDKLESALPAFMAQLLREYYRRAGDIPSEIYLSHPVEDIASWQEWLINLRGKNVLLNTPQRGIKKEAVELAHKNATFKLREITLKNDLKKVINVTPADIQLQETLQLHSVPETIECFDISNFQGKETVASLVYFKKGKPLKSRYRRFKIKTVEGIDDFASMAEVLTRYYGKLVEKGIAPADLVLVDGGKGQLSAARTVLANFGLHTTQLIGLAKREETIVSENGSINLPRNSEALKLLQHVRDEAHRFAITYHRLIRDRKTVASVLDQIPGIGPTKKLSLLHHFGSVAMISKATGEELSEVRGINKHDIVVIREFFAKNPTQ